MDNFIEKLKEYVRQKLILAVLLAIILPPTIVYIL